MIPTTRSSKLASEHADAGQGSGGADPDTHIVSLDVGTSSVRTLLFDGRARQRLKFGSQRPYRVTTTPDGGVEVDADELLRLSIECLSELHAQMREARYRAAAVSFCAFWHSFLGIDAGGRPTTPIIHLFDTRSAGHARRLASEIDERENHARTGCVLHTSYWPAKLLWLAENRPEAVAATRHWVSFGEYLYLKLFGRARTSTSMVSGSGIWNPNLGDYDREILKHLPVELSQLAPVDEMDEPVSGLLPEFAGMWPAFAQIRWYPALGDGACNNIGSGCITPDRFSLMVGTSGAMRAVIEADRVEIPPGLWCYRVDRRRFVLGGALSNGGEVYAWMKRTLALPPAEEVEARLAGMEPGAHGLTILPLFAGERSPYWNADARAAFTGMSMHTAPMDILRAALESVALRFRQVYLILKDRIGEPAEVVASGGALLNSPAWTQMMADATGHPVVTCCEQEASSRGAALLALERLGAISHIRDLPAETGRVFTPVAAHQAVYDEMLLRQMRLYTKLFEEA
ncbi:MAG: gluconokinase [Bryobacteraceae bacterium]